MHYITEQIDFKKYGENQKPVQKIHKSVDHSQLKPGYLKLKETKLRLNRVETVDNWLQFW
jgi:hypothetical protein